MPEHNDRPDLVGEHPQGDLVQVILFVFFMVLWIADSFFLHYTDFFSKYISPFIRIPLSVIILAVSGYVAFMGHRIVFEEERESPVVIAQGLFGTLRHPLYFSVILFYLGLLISTCSVATAVVWITILIFYNYIASYEENLLIEHFGNEYEAYMKDVPRWIPRFNKKLKGDNV